MQEGSLRTHTPQNEGLGKPSEEAISIHWMMTESKDITEHVLWKGEQTIVLWPIAERKKKKKRIVGARYMFYYDLFLHLNFMSKSPLLSILHFFLFFPVYWNITDYNTVLVQSVQHNDLCVTCEMITTTGLVNIYHFT